MPGLEVKYALEEANKAGSKVVYLGYEVDEATLARLYHENRNTVLKGVLNLFRLNAKYIRELYNSSNLITHHGIRKYIESNCDQYTINWYI